MRISFIEPKWNQLVNSYPSLGLGYLAAVAEQEGHECRIHDFGLRPHVPVEEDVKEVLEFKPDLVAFTSMTTSYYSVEKAAQIIKEELGVPIIIGGPHATTLPEETLKNPNIDFLIFGEGEVAWRNFIQALEAGDDRWDMIQGLWFKTEDGTIVSGGNAPLVKNLDELPFPARHLFNLEAYPLYAPNGERMITLMSSRGCPYNCSFCFKGIVGRTYRQRSPQNIVAEIRDIMEKYGTRNFYFIDDLFTINVKRLEKILDYMIESNLDIRFRCLARVDRVNPELLKKMYKAGCRQIHYGIESGNEEVLKRTAKHINLEQVRQAVQWTEEAGIASKGYFILGLPGDNEQTIQDTIEFAASLPLTEAMFSIATPFPGTKLWEELIQRRPELKYNADFTKAYYYNSYTSEIAPFMNVSDVPDEKLSKLAIEARKRFLEAKARRTYHKAFGPTLGEVFWKVGRNNAVRSMGRGLMNLGMFKRFKYYKTVGEAELWS